MPENPYNRLKERFREYVEDCEYRHTRTMFTLTKNVLSGPLNLTDVYERTMAADQLGYDVVLSCNKDGMTIQYKKKIPDIPWEVR